MTQFEAPKHGEAISMSSGKLAVPDHPILPFIEGDGTGPDIWRAAQAVLDASVEKAYGGKKKIAWYEVFAGEKAKKKFDSWLPEETVEAYRKYLVGIKGPLTTPVGKGIRSLNVALRQQLDLYVCLRPVRWFTNVPSPVKKPGDVDIVIFRENTEDIYAGIEWQAETPDAKKVIDFLQKEMGVTKIRFPETSGIGIKPVSRQGTERLVRAAINYALATKRSNVALVHKGNIMKFTEGAFRDWGYALAKKEFRGQIVTERESWILGQPGEEPEAHRRRERQARRARLRHGAARGAGGSARRGRGGDEARAHARRRQVQEDAARARHHRRHHAAAGADPRQGVQRRRHLEPERRLPVRRARGPGRRHRHRARRQHQLRHRPRHLRGHPRHRAEVRRPRQGEPGLGDPERRDDAASPGLERSRGSRRSRASTAPSARRR